jgi:methylmalonyl-CoA mutase N-terminal domain/subunit
MERGEEIVVGVNAFQFEEKVELERLRVDPAIEQEHRSRLKALRDRRDANRVSEMLARLEKSARSAENLVPLIIECVENEITLGEICRALRDIWGEYEPPAWI